MNCFQCASKELEIENVKIDLELAIKELLLKDSSNIIAKNILLKYFDIKHNINNINSENKFYIIKPPIRNIKYKI